MDKICKSLFKFPYFCVLRPTGAVSYTHLMNREHKRQKYEKGYYKTHPCTDSFTCKACGRLVVSDGAGSGHRNHCPNCLSSLHLDNEPGDRASDCGSVMDAVDVYKRQWLYRVKCEGGMNHEYAVIRSISG